VIYPSEFIIEFEDYVNTSKLSQHEKHIKEVSPRVEPSKEWLMKVKHSSREIQILSPSTTIPCSLRGTNIDTLHNPTIGTSIMSEFLAKNLLGNMPLVLTNKLFKSPLGLFFECCGIASDVPVIIDKIEVFIDFHIYAILEFDILIGYPLEKLFQEKSFHGGLDEKLGIAASTTPVPCPESPMVKHYPNQDQFEEVKFISPFVSPKRAYEIERSSSPSLEPEPCPSGHPNIILENKNFHARDISKAPTLEIEEHESFSFETLHVSCSCLESPEFVVLSAACYYEEDNHPSLLIFKLFRRMVVDVFVYHKYCKSRCSTVLLTLRLNKDAICLVVEVGTIVPLIATR
jgi:hypothetical protein